jgi:very-short-patch-repair endonuclease
MRISDLSLMSPSARKQLYEKLGIAPAKKKKTRTQPASDAEEMFVGQCRIRKLPMFQREFKFALSKGRGYRFDFCWEEFKVAVEIEGLVCKYIDGIPYALGRHCTFTGFENDCQKYAIANELGWHVNRFNQALVKNWTAIDMTIDLLKARGWKP